MGDAPDRITYNPGYKVTYEGADPTRGYVYIRADLHQAAIDRADADKAAAVEAMREACAALCGGNEAGMQFRGATGWALSPRAEMAGTHHGEAYAAAIRAIPVPARMTATQAARVPEVAAMIEATKNLIRDVKMNGFISISVDYLQEVGRAIAPFTEAKP